MADDTFNLPFQKVITVDRTGAYVAPGMSGSLVAGNAIIGKVGIDQTTPGTTNGVVANAGENHIGNVGSPGDVITFTPTLDTSAYADGDLLFDFTSVSDFVRVNGGRAIIQSLTVIDKADQKIAFDLFTSPVTIDAGTFNSAPTISDADAALGVQNPRAPGKTYSVEVADYKDLGGVSVATVTGIGLMVEADSASRAIFLAAVIRGAPTYGASDLVFRFGLVWF